MDNEESTELNNSSLRPSLLEDLPNTNNSNIDKITLELLMNNRMYSKYLSKTDPMKYNEHASYRESISQYKKKIMEITEVMLSDKQFNNNLNETFHIYVKSCIKYLENKELEEKYTKDSYSDDDDEENLFEENSSYTGKDTKIRHETSMGVFGEESDNFPKSFWGKQVKKGERNYALNTKVSDVTRDIHAFSSNSSRNRKQTS
jgi:hypothetical protein